MSLSSLYKSITTDLFLVSLEDSLALSKSIPNILHTLVNILESNESKSSMILLEILINFIIK